MSGVDYSVQHWQQRAVLAERRLEELRSASPRLGEAALPSPPPRVPHEVLSVINSNFGSSIQVFSTSPASPISVLSCYCRYSRYQAHDVAGAAAVLRVVHEDFLDLRREHEILHSMMAGDNLLQCAACIVMRSSGQAIAFRDLDHVQVQVPAARQSRSSRLHCVC